MTTDLLSVAADLAARVAERHPAILTASRATITNHGAPETWNVGDPKFDSPLGPLVGVDIHYPFYLAKPTDALAAARSRLLAANAEVQHLLTADPASRAS